MSAVNIVNDKFICRLLFADTREVSVSERMREANLIIIIVNVKFILTFTIIDDYQPKYSTPDLNRSCS